MKLDRKTTAHLREQRRLKGITFQEIADAIEVSPVAICKFELHGDGLSVLKQRAYQYYVTNAEDKLNNIIERIEAMQSK